MMRLCHFLYLLLVGCMAWSQTIQYPFDSKDRALLFYQQKDYANAWSAWELQDKSENTYKSEEKSYRILSSALRLNTPGTEKKLKTFLLEHPISWYGVGIPLDLANFYFDNEKYSYALKWFSKVKKKDVPKPQLAQYYFNKGYTQFLKRRYKTAKSLLEKVQDNPEYQSDVHYYLGHIAYQLEDYEGANQSFGKVSNPDQRKDLGYFKVDMNFKLGRFEQALTLGESELEKPNAPVSELSKIIGESYFNLKQYNEALPYLLQYEGKNKKWSNVDYYQLGYTHYHLSNFQEAGAQFNKIVGKKDALSQNAYYFLGYCYLESDQPTAARNAFRSASMMSFDEKVNEDALFQYAKLSYQLGNPYESPQQVINQFITAYPDHPEITMMEELLVDSYTRLGNYKEALNLLNEGKLFKDNATLQKVLFLQAYKSYQQGNYREAISYFNQATKKNESIEIQLRALYWQAQSEYQFNRFEVALDLFNSFEDDSQSRDLEEWNAFYYNKGYTYYKLKQYESAIKSFELQKEKEKTLKPAVARDLYLRLGDSYFANKQYWPAMENYNKAISFDPSKGSYALYQKAISYGFVNRNPQKIENLKALIDSKAKHNLIDDALYALASTLASVNKTGEAINQYDRLLKFFPKSPYRSRVLLNKGLILYNLELLNEATNVLRQLVVVYPKSSAAQQGLSTLREIAVESGEVTSFSRWLKDNSIRSFSSNELEQTAFEAAEKKFLDNKKKQAEKLLEEYIESHPQGVNSIAANFYLAEIKFEDSNWEQAVNSYKNVIDSDNEYTEKALVRSAMALVNDSLYTSAIPVWQRLEAVANFEENKRYAHFNLMKAFYNEGRYLESVTQSEKVIELPDLKSSIKWDAYELLAHSALQLKDTLKAQKAFQTLEKAPKDIIAAEALYFSAWLSHKNKAFKKSNETIAIIAKQYSSAGEWSAKSLLLMALNFDRLEDSFQALFIVDSIIENFQEYPSIVSQAKELKVKLEKKESEQNESIKTDAKS